MNKNTRTFLAVVGLPALAVAFLWIPFGFSLGGLVEEWGFLELFARNGVFYIVNDATLASQKARPLNVLPQAVAYTLDPDTFFYWHVILAAILTVKGACAAVIGIYLTGSRALAAFLGLLTLLYPADTMQLNFRSISVNGAVTLALLANVLFVSSLDIKQRWLSFGVAVLASVVLGAGLLMWEGVAGLAVLPFLLVFAREGKGSIRIILQRPETSAIWLVTVAGWLTFFVLAVKSGSEYQVALLSGASLEAVPKLLGALATSGIYRAFFECWIEVVNIVVRDLSNFAYPVCFAGVMLVGLFILAREECGESAENKDIIAAKSSMTIGLAARTAIVGLLAFILGYAPFLASVSHLLITQRTFLTSAIGGALVLFGVVIFLLSVLNKRLVLVACGLLISGCMVAQLYQFDRYNRIYANIYRPLLSAITPFVWDATDRPYAVVFNDYGYLSDVWDLGLELKPALGYLLPDQPKLTKIEPKQRVFICEAYSDRVLPRWHGEPERRYCRRTNESIVITGDDRQLVELKGALIGRLSDKANLTKEEPESELTRRPLPSRVVHLLSTMKWRATDSMFKRGEYTDRFACNFEYMWGYAVPCRTFGFFEAQPLHAALGSSYAWIGETYAGLIFDLEPSRTNYRLLIEVQSSASPSREVEIKLNGASLSSNWHDPARIEASFTSDLLRRTNNVLILHTELDQKLGLSIAAKSVSIVPEESAINRDAQAEK